MTNIFVKTFGCSVNAADTERMLGLLKKADFHLVDDVERAELIIVNSCAVKGPTQDSLFKYLKTLPKRPVIVTGCIAQTQPELLKKYSLCGTKQIHRIVEVAEEAIHDNVIQLIDDEEDGADDERLNLPKIRRNNAIEILPICSGCLGDPCSYCIVKSARGALVSYDEGKVVERAGEALKDGVKEIWITAQDTGCYGKDTGSSLPKLLKRVVSLEGDFKVRLGMLNPNHAIEFLDELLDVYESSKMFKFIHLPVQSGNDRILKLMRRKYSAADYKEIVTKIRKRFPLMTIATDIIVGFPSETEREFEDSLRLVKETMPSVLNRSRFCARPGTEAEKMQKKIHGRITKERSRKITELFRNISLMQNEKFFKWKGKVIVDEKLKDGNFVARNEFYKPIVLHGEYKLGDVIEVVVSKVGVFSLGAEPAPKR